MTYPFSDYTQMIVVNVRF